jgi:hypothetical protein
MKYITYICRSHIFHDLAPYVCTFDKCPKPDQIFSKRSEWFNHEFQYHRKEWVCGTPGHETYDQAKEFEEHLRQKHPAWFVESELPSLLKIFARPSQAPFTPCPLCTEIKQEEQNGEYCQTDDGEPITVRQRV